MHPALVSRNPYQFQTDPLACNGLRIGDKPGSGRVGVIGWGGTLRRIAEQIAWLEGCLSTQAAGLCGVVRPGRRVATLAGCVAVLAASGCQSITTDTAALAQVRFVNTSSGVPAVDLYVNETGVAYNLSAGTVTSYVPVLPGEYRVSAHLVNTAQSLVNARAALASRRQYTMVVSGAVGDLQASLYPDATGPAPQGMMSVRVLNASTAAGVVDVYVVPGVGSLAISTPTVRDFGPGSSTGYENLPAEKTYSVAVTPAGASPGAANATVLSGVTVGGGSGAVRTVVITDAANGKARGFGGFVLNDYEMP